MIERTFGNYKIWADPLEMEMHILGQRFGWKATYPAKDIPAKIVFYEGLLALTKKKSVGNNVHHHDVLKCLRWADKVLNDE